MIPTFKAGFFGVAVLELPTARVGSDSDSVAVSFEADDSFLEAFTIGSGDGEKDFCFVTGICLLFIPPRIPSFIARGFELVSLLLIGAGGEPEELDRRSALGLPEDASVESESSP